MLRKFDSELGGQGGKRERGLRGGYCWQKAGWDCKSMQCESAGSKRGKGRNGAGIVGSERVEIDHSSTNKTHPLQANVPVPSGRFGDVFLA
jgi:hypothetical protein